MELKDYIMNHCPSYKEMMDFIKKHYPSADITINGIGEDSVHFEWNMSPKFNPKFMYGKLFKTFKWLEYIIEEGGWNSWVYTKTTLKYGGYYNE